MISSLFKRGYDWTCKIFEQVSPSFLSNSVISVGQAVEPFLRSRLLFYACVMLIDLLPFKPEFKLYSLLKSSSKSSLESLPNFASLWIMVGLTWGFNLLVQTYKIERRTRPLLFSKNWKQKGYQFLILTFILGLSSAIISKTITFI